MLGLANRQTYDGSTREPQVPYGAVMQKPRRRFDNPASSSIRLITLTKVAKAQLTQPFTVL